MIVEIKGISKKFDTKTVLNNISFSVNEGEIFALIGPNGAGKTTTLRCLYGELKPESGSINIFGKELCTSLKTKIAVMTEDRLTFRRFNGEDYIKMWKMLYPNWQDKTFNSFSVHYRFNMDQPVETYSMGMRTLFNLALVVSSNADLLILDEPTQNLDPVIREEVTNILRDYSVQKGKTVIISSHEIYDLEEVASSFAIIFEGHVLYTDSIDRAKEIHRMVSRNETIDNGELIGLVNDEILVKTDKNIGRYANFKEIVLGYLQGKKAFKPFEITTSDKQNDDSPFTL